MSQSIIRLNIGGSVFTTTRSTIELNNGFLRTLISQDSDWDEYFVDRDPTFFRWILNILRGSTAIPKKYEDYMQLKFEADFYCIDIPPYMSLNNSIESTLERIANKMSSM